MPLYNSSLCQGVPVPWCLCFKERLYFQRPFLRSAGHEKLLDVK